MLNFFSKKSETFEILLIVILCTMGMINFCYLIEVSEAFNPDNEKYLVLIIDDYGNNAEGTQELLEMGIKMTAAVMPGLPYSELDAKRNFEAGNDVILHLPMQAKSGSRGALGPYAITIGMNDSEVCESVQSGLQSVKYAVGVNNHMGSKVMENKKIMSQVMRVCGENRLIFVNSKTTNSKVARQAAEQFGIFYYERDVFLDDTKSVKNTKNQLKKAAKIAEKRGYAIAIGHVGNAGGKTTVAGIKEMVDELQGQGITFITVSELKEILDTDMGLSKIKSME